MRPRALDEVVGQQHLLGPRAPLRRLVESDEPMSLVLYGPPGTGKTTLAHVISLATKRQFVQLSALDSGVKEVRAVITAAKRELTYAGRRTVLFIDEVHRFSKTQQDSLLSAVEDRTVSLVAATTGNPVFSGGRPLPPRPEARPPQRPRPARRRHPHRGGGGAPAPDRRWRRPEGPDRAGVRRRGSDVRRHRRPRPGDPRDRRRPGGRPLRPAGRPALR